MKQVKYLIIGAGISGLTTANELLAYGTSKDEVLVVEANPHIGGLIRTERTDGYLTEWGPEGLRGGSENTKRIFELIDIDPIPADEEAKIRYIGQDDEIIKVPSGPISAITTKLIPFSGKLRIFKEPFVNKKEDDETVAEFVERRLGKHVVPLIDAFVTGVFGGDPNQLSIRYAFPSMKEIEVEYGNLIPGAIRHAKQKKQKLKEQGIEPVEKDKDAPFLLTTKDGMQGILEGLAKNINVKLSNPVKSIRLGDQIEVETETDTYQAKHVIVATGINALQHISITDGTTKFTPPQIDEATVMVVTLGFEPDAFVEKVEGYGFLIPDNEDRFLMGTLFSSRLFDFKVPQDQIMLRCFIGGIRHPDRPDMEQDRILEQVLADLDDYLGVNKPPVFTQFQCHHQRGIPQLQLEHDQFTNWRSKIQNSYDNIYFSGIGWNAISCDKLIEESRTLVETHLLN